MFIRTKQRRRADGTTRLDYQVVENYRDGGRVRQRVLLHLQQYPTLEAAAAEWPAELAAWEADVETATDPQTRQQAEREVAEWRESLARLHALLAGEQR